MSQVALITGGSRGLGGTLAEFLAAQGYTLVLTARDRDRLADAALSLARYGVRIRAIAGDVADPVHRHRLAAEVRSLGRLDLLVNNASELGPTPLPALGGYPLDALERLFEVNTLAPLGLIQLLLPLVRSASGLIVNVSSDAAIGGYPGWGGYGASKAALDLISLTLANELVGQGIAVTSVDPGDLRTAMHQAAYPGEDISDRPLPEATLPFWAWLLGQPRSAVNGRRFQSQSRVWEVAA